VKNVAPSYQEAHFDAASKRGKLKLVASPDGREGSVSINQDANVYAALVDGADRVEFAQRAGRRTYVHVVRGALTVAGQPLGAGDALKSVGESRIVLEAGRDAEVLLFDLP
jgi:redox-sensitive bicupin YhaK (pirin superfamily)